MIEMEERKCVGCAKKFRVLKTSKTKFCSAYCQELTTGQAPIKNMTRVPTGSEAEFIKSGKRPESGKNIGVIQAFELKNANAAATTIRKQNEGKTPMHEINVEPNGPEKTKPLNLKRNANGMPETKSEPAQKSLSVVEQEIPPSDLQNYDTTLRRVELTSLNLIDDSAKHLHECMTSVALKHKERMESRTLTSSDIHDITSLANSITGLMKIKVEALKIARSMLKVSK